MPYDNVLYINVSLQQLKGPLKLTILSCYFTLDYFDAAVADDDLDDEVVKDHNEQLIPPQHRRSTFHLSY